LWKPFPSSKPTQTPTQTPDNTTRDALLGSAGGLIGLAMIGVGGNKLFKKFKRRGRREDSENIDI